VPSVRSASEEERLEWLEQPLIARLRFGKIEWLDRPLNPYPRKR
jgi:hypothetical protein